MLTWVSSSSVGNVATLEVVDSARWKSAGRDSACMPGQSECKKVQDQDISIVRSLAHLRGPMLRPGMRGMLLSTSTPTLVQLGMLSALSLRALARRSTRAHTFAKAYQPRRHASFYNVDIAGLTEEQEEVRVLYTLRRRAVQYMCSSRMLWMSLLNGRLRPEQPTSTGTTTSLQCVSAQSTEACSKLKPHLC